MSTRSWILFLVPVLVWSTTYYAITLQLGSVTTPTYAVGLRFAAASALLFSWLLARGEALALSATAHRFALASGICAYGISYLLTYFAEQSVPSGLVAIMFTLMVFLTPLLARVAYGTTVAPRTWIGGALGVSGVALCFLPDLVGSAVSADFVRGVAAMVMAALASSVAAVISMRLNQNGIPIATYTAWAMAYGAAMTFVYGALDGQSIRFDTRASFWLSFAHLTLAGTLAAFLCYLHLLKREGSARTMYISVLSPIGAVIVSVLVEGLRPQALTYLGILLALGGAWITLRTDG